MPMPANAEEAKDSHWQVSSFVSQLKCFYKPWIVFSLPHFQFLIVSIPHPFLPPIPNSLLSPLVEPCRVQSLGVARIQGLLGYTPPALTSKIMKFKSLSKRQKHLNLGFHDSWRGCISELEKNWSPCNCQKKTFIKTDIQKTKIKKIKLIKLELLEENCYDNKKLTQNTTL